MNQSPEGHYEQLPPSASFERERPTDKEIINQSLERNADVEARLVGELGVTPGSDEADTLLGEALLAVAEATDKSPHATPEEVNSAFTDVVVQAGVELGRGLPPKNVVSLLESAVSMLRKDPVFDEDDDQSGPVEFITSKPEHSFGNEVKPGAMLGATFMDENDPYLTRVRVGLGLPPEARVAIAKSVDMPRAKEVLDRYYHGTQEHWQQDVFGEKVSNVELCADVRNRFEIPVEERAGQALFVEGRERRPIMDISFNDQTAEEIADMIATRDKGLESVSEQLHELISSEAKVGYSQVRDILERSGVIGRQHGNMFKPGENSGGTIADLFVDSDVLSRAEQIDIQIQQLLGEGADHFTVASQFEAAVVNLAANSFPGDVEMMHAIDVKTIDSIMRHGSLATRSARHHGVHVQNGSLNGALIHFTRPGGYAPEYGGLVAGYPVKDIVKETPYVHLEDDYIGNEFKANDTDRHYSSTQYHMGEVQLNTLDGAPDAFRAAFLAMHHRLDQGLMPVNIGQGMYNNFSFAKTGEADTAGAYSYPLSEASLYINVRDADTLFEAARRNGTFDSTVERTTIVGLAPGVEDPYRMNSNSEMTIASKNFSFDERGGLSFFAPIFARVVPFTERAAGNAKNQSSIEYREDTIGEGTMSKYVGGLIESAKYQPEDSLRLAADDINEHGGKVGDLLLSIAGGYDALQQRSVPLSDVFDAISDEKIIEAGLATLPIINQVGYHPERVGDTEQQIYSQQIIPRKEDWYTRGILSVSNEAAQDITNGYIERLKTADFNEYARWYDALAELGYVADAETVDRVHSALAALKAEQDEARKQQSSIDNQLIL